MQFQPIRSCDRQLVAPSSSHPACVDRFGYMVFLAAKTHKHDTSDNRRMSMCECKNVPFDQIQIFESIRKYFNVDLTICIDLIYLFFVVCVCVR